MKIVRDKTGEYGDCAFEYLDFEKFDDDSEEEVLFYGYATPYNNDIKDKYKNFKRKVYYQGEQPCGLFSYNTEVQNNSLRVVDYFDELYSTCPYSAEWMNKINNFDKYRPIIFPHNMRWAVTENENPDKFLDVIYWGNIPEGKRDSKTVLNIVQTIPKFKHAFFTLGLGLPQELIKYVTARNARRPTMWQFLKTSKIMVTSNLLFLVDEEIEAIKQLPNWQENEAFCRLDQKITPQIKTRPIEAIFNKTLVLLKEDPWHIFDHWFEPEKEFVYYKNDEDLEDKIKEILNNWDHYQVVAENAYQKAVKLYTTERTFKTIAEKSLR
tara:strand:+ start:354 stop:1325 length:972 start_codon:yes stop_codon:yes gene_type:complete